LPANQSFLKAFEIALIGWIKAGPPKRPFLRTYEQAIYFNGKHVNHEGRGSDIIITETADCHFFLTGKEYFGSFFLS